MTKNTAGLSDRLNDLAARLRRLTPCWQDPERFHLAKSELVAELRRMAVEAPAPQVKRVVVPVERIVERIVQVPVPRRSRQRRSEPAAPVLYDLFQKGSQ